MQLIDILKLQADSLETNTQV